VGYSATDRGRSAARVCAARQDKRSAGVAGSVGDVAEDAAVGENHVVSGVSTAVLAGLSRDVCTRFDSTAIVALSRDGANALAGRLLV